MHLHITLNDLSTAASAVALWIAAATYRRQARGERAVQAAKVSVVWIRVADARGGAFRLRNASDLPIHRCLVTVSEPATHSHISHNAGNLDASDTRDLDPNPDMTTAGWPAFEINYSFVDAQGVGWTRSTDGRLTVTGIPNKFLTTKGGAVRMADTTRGLRWLPQRMAKWPDRIRHFGQRIWWGH